LQERSGENGQTFRCIKFRSMRVNADADRVQATRDDPRKTRFGDFLRRSSIDELPQFINVLKGDMSIVGPRPHMLQHTEQYSKLINKYMVRHLIKPGITGWAQVTGYRGETHSLSQMEGRVRRDIWYLENWSLLLDIRIIFMTVWNALRQDENAY
ncbi:undecaprenyl-phosphate glucose phosphotransferase, partial [Alistipes onderdonkii]